MNYENYELCHECGGRCCKKSGCDYYTSDFDALTKEALINILNTGNVSIVAAMVLNDSKQGEILMAPILYLRARNEGREVVDLLSLKRRCSMLTDEGCTYSLKERPSGGVHFIPYENNKCKRDDDARDELLKWLPYQNVLGRMVKRYAHMSVDARLRLDVETLFKDILNENYEGVAREELEDVLSGLPELMSCFPKEYEKARKACLLTSKILRVIK